MDIARTPGSVGSLLWRSLAFVACTLGTVASLAWVAGPGPDWG